MLYIHLLERVGFIIILAYIVMQFRFMRTSMDYNRTFKNQLLFILIFGCFAIIGTNTGVKVGSITEWQVPLISSVEENQAIANARTMGIVLAGLLGGVVPALWVGLIAAIHRLMIGGFLAPPIFFAIIIQSIVAGLLKKWIDKNEGTKQFNLQVFLIGLLVEAIQMIVVYILMLHNEEAISIVKKVALPQILANGVGVVVFFQLNSLIKEMENQKIADYTIRAFSIARHTLPQWSKNFDESIKAVSSILFVEMKAVGVRFLTNGIESEKIGDKTKFVAFLPFEMKEQVVSEFQLFYKTNQEAVLAQKVIENGLKDLLLQQVAFIEINKQKHLIREAELRSLRAQMNPHFLFNMLNTIKSLIRTNPPSARELITKLATYLRSTISSYNELISIKEEMKNVYLYLDLIKARMGERIRIVENIDERALKQLIPPFSIQPLVENAIQHGLQHKVANGEVRISIWVEERGVRIQVDDNGIWHEKSEDESEGIALKNIQERLRYYFNHTNFNVQTSAEGTSVSFYVGGLK
ncbi:MAG: LytS/YhcK type 5TM receptor domain-containing protein [Bacillaceae bacterium]